MFNNLTDKLQTAFRKLTGKGQLSERNMGEALEEIRKALLEADVNYEIANQFIDSVRQECVGQEVLKSVTPGQQTIKIVNDKLVELMGGADAPLNLDATPSVIMLCGLHGSGKTTTSAKLALYIQKKLKKRVLLAACDLMRPAAIDQLEVLGHELGMPVYADRTTPNVVAVAAAAVAECRRQGRDVVILDTAGRLQIDADLVQELVMIKQVVQPQEILLVGDAALGQEAVSVARHFDEALGLTGVILTKLDGDARGGAALSIRQVTGKPIKFVTVGEKPTDLEAFHPDRMASRLLGMGDVVTLVERAAEQIKEEEAKELEEKIRQSTFGFDDFLVQMQRIKRMGGLMSLLKMIPGMGSLPIDQVKEDDMRRMEGIVNSMTKSERRLPEIINSSRRQRIAKGCGVNYQEVSALIKQFLEMRTMMAQMSRGGLFGGMPSMPSMPTMPPMGGGMGRPPMGMGGGYGVPRPASQSSGLSQQERDKKAAKRKMAEKSRKKNRNRR